MKKNGFIKRKKFALELNSHSLSYYQQCEQRYDFEQIKLLQINEEYYPFKRGAGISRALAIWYLAKQKNYQSKKLEKLEEFLFKKMAKSDAFFNEKYKTNDRMHIASRIIGYFNKYRNEGYSVIAVEKGFSKILYEDDNVLFTYSGRPDVILDFGKGFGIGPMDHKSESRRNDLTKFNNQFVGYCWALNSNVGVINYIGLQKDAKDNEVLRRESFTFTNEQIERWKDDTIKWYHRIARSIINNSFIRSWHCDGKYGVCKYHNLCISGSAAEELIKIERDFIKLPEPYKSW